MRQINTPLPIIKNADDAKKFLTDLQNEGALFDRAEYLKKYNLGTLSEEEQKIKPILDKVGEYISFKEIAKRLEDCNIKYGDSPITYLPSLQLWFIWENWEESKEPLPKFTADLKTFKPIEEMPQYFFRCLSEEDINNVWSIYKYDLSPMEF